MSFNFRPLIAVAAIALSTPVFAQTSAQAQAIAPTLQAAPAIQAPTPAVKAAPTVGTTAATTATISTKDKLAKTETSLPKQHHKTAKSIVPTKTDTSVKTDAAIAK